MKHAEQITAGTLSSATWQNPKLEKALNDAFNIRPNEKIVEVSSSSQGITVKIERQ